MYQSWKYHLRDKARSNWKTQDKFSRIYSNRRVRRVIKISTIFGDEDVVTEAESSAKAKRRNDFWNIFD